MRKIFITSQSSSSASRPGIVELTPDEIDLVYGGQFQFSDNLGNIYSSAVINGMTHIIFPGGMRVAMSLSDDGDTFTMSYNGDTVEMEHMGGEVYDISLNGIGMLCGVSNPFLFPR